MSEKSLFAVLLRSPWWISFALAGLVGLLARLFMPVEFGLLAALAGLPFAVIGCLAAWRQRRVPSAAQVEATLLAVRAMPWPAFADTMEAALRQDGYTVTLLPGPGADFALVKSGRSVLLSCKRWKAAQQGVEPLRALEAARCAQAAQLAIYVSVDALSENAQRFATAHGMELLQGAALAQLLKGVVGAPRSRLS